MIPFINLRKIDKKRLRNLKDRVETNLKSDDIWFVHTVLAQCFLPYHDPKTERWHKKNGAFSILLTAGAIEEKESFRVLGLPFGAKPRLFQSYMCTQAIKHQSPVIPVEPSMTAMLVELGYDPKGGPRGNIASFKEQITRFARCHFTLVGPGPLEGMRRYIETTPIKQFDVWFAPHPKQGTLWPSEIVLTDDYYYSLKDHAVPFDFRAFKAIQNNPRSQDIYLWMTQRLCRIPQKKPLLMLWKDLHEMFGGRTAFRRFKQLFPEELTAARIAYPDARVELQKDGALFRTSLPPIPKTTVGVRKKIM